MEDRLRDVRESPSLDILKTQLDQVQQHDLNWFFSEWVVELTTSRDLLQLKIFNGKGLNKSLILKPASYHMSDGYVQSRHQTKLSQKQNPLPHVMDLEGPGYHLLWWIDLFLLHQIKSYGNI